MEKANSKEDEDNFHQTNAAMSNSCKLETSQDEHESGSVLQTLLLPKNESRKTNKWTAKEDMLLKELVATYGEKSWRKISSTMNNRSAIQCLHRWSKILKPGLVKGPWTSDEDQKLMQWVSSNGSMKWSECSSVITGRSGKQCRERWFNNLNPDVKKGNWTEYEDNAIFQGYFEHGSSWSRIAKELEGRTENSVKNRFYSTVRKLISDLEKQCTNIDNNNHYHPCNTTNSSLISAQQPQQAMSSGNEGGGGASTIAYSNQRIVEVLRSITNDNKFSKKEKLNISEKDDQNSSIVNITNGITIEDKHNNARTNEEFTCKESVEDEMKQQLEQNNSEQKISSKIHSNGQASKNTNSILQASKQPGQEYSEQNYLYRLILNGNVNIKKTASMQDYAMLQKNKLKGNQEQITSDKEKKIHKGKIQVEQDQQQHSQEPKKKLKKMSDRSNENGETSMIVVGSQVNRQQGQGSSGMKSEKQKDQIGRDSSQIDREDKLGGQKQQRQQGQKEFESLKRKNNNNSTCEKQKEEVIAQEEDDQEEEENQDSDEGEDDGDGDDKDESEISEQFGEEISKAMSVSLAKFMKSKLAEFARSIKQNYNKSIKEQSSNCQVKIETEVDNNNNNKINKDKKKLSHKITNQIDKQLSNEMALKNKKSQDKIDKNESKRIDHQKRSQFANGIASEKDNQQIQAKYQEMKEGKQVKYQEITNHQLKQQQLDKQEPQKQQIQQQQQLEKQLIQQKIEETTENQNQRQKENQIREQQQIQLQQLQQQLQQQQQQQQQQKQEQLFKQQQQLFVQSINNPNMNAAEEVRGEGRIDFLINQLNSLMSLLNTTKNELNKLESSQKQPIQPSTTLSLSQPGWVRPVENQQTDIRKHVLPFKMNPQQQQTKQLNQIQKQQQQQLIQPSQINKDSNILSYPEMKQPHQLDNHHQHSLLSNPLNGQTNTDYFESSFSLQFLEMDQCSGLVNNNNNNSHMNNHNQQQEYIKQEHQIVNSPFRNGNIQSGEFLSPQIPFGHENLVQENQPKK